MIQVKDLSYFSRRRKMTELEEELLLVSCVDYLLQYGGLAFIELIIEIKENKRQRSNIDPLVTREPLSLDLEPYDDGDTLIDFIADERMDPLEAVLDRSTTEFVDSLVEELRPKEQEVICMRFGLRGHNIHTLESAGQKLGVTRERVRQIESKVLRILRTRLRAKGFEKKFI